MLSNWWPMNPFTESVMQKLFPCHVVLRNVTTKTNYKSKMKKKIKRCVQDSWFAFLFCFVFQWFASGRFISDLIMSAMACPITGAPIVCSAVCLGAHKKPIKAPRHWPLRRESTANEANLNDMWKYSHGCFKENTNFDKWGVKLNVS